MNSVDIETFEIENALGIGTCETNFIASRIANTDSLIRQIRENVEENERLRNRIAVLKSSAIQVKSLYEEELNRNSVIASTNNEYLEQIRYLQDRCSALENEKTSNDLIQKETFAELEKKFEYTTNKYSSMCIDVVNWGLLMKENDIFPSNNEFRFREAKSHVQTMNNSPKELIDRLNKFAKNGHRSKVKRKETKDAAVNTDHIVIEYPTKSLFDDDTITSDSGRESNVSMSTDFEDLTFGTPMIEDHIPQKPRMVEISVNTEIVGDFYVKPSMVTASTNTDPPECKKVYVDKATMHLPSLVTRATSTSSFIKYTDVGVNFPEHVSKSIEEIFHEMVVELPDLVLPIADLPDIEDEILSQGAVKSTQTNLLNEIAETSTQTDLLDEIAEISTQTESSQTEKQYNSIGTVTTLKNVRNKVEYCRKSSKLLNNDFLNIKKEEVLSPAISLSNLALNQESEKVQPHVANCWGILGEFIFKLMATGKMCDEQSLYMLIEKINMIRALLAGDDKDLDCDFLKEKEFESQTIETITKVPRLTENIISSVEPPETMRNMSCDSDDEEGFLGFEDDEILSIQNELDLKKKYSVENFNQSPVNPSPPTKIEQCMMHVLQNELTNDGNDSDDDRLVIDDFSESTTKKAISTNLLPFLSPIKLKETNLLVKDQFKTPEPIKRSKRRQQNLEVQKTLDTKRPKNDQLAQDYLAKIEEIRQYFSLPDLLEEIDDLDIRMCLFDSTTSDSPEEPDTVVEETCSFPKIIPLQHVSYQKRGAKKHGSSLLNREIGQFNTKVRAEVIRKFQQEDKANEEIEKLMKIIDSYVISPWTTERISHFCSQILTFTMEPRSISLAILKCIIVYEDLQPNMQFSPPAPALPETHQKLVLLVKLLAKTVNSLESTIFKELENRIFTLKAESPNVTVLSCYTFFYIGLADIHPVKCSAMRFFIYKCLYYYKFKCIPLIYIVLKAYPWLLPKQNCEYYDNSDAIINTLKCILVNFPYSSGKPVRPEQNVDEYNKKRLLYLLMNNYGYKIGSPSYNDLIENLVEKTKANKLKNITHAFILLAKRHDFEWANKHLIAPHIRPLLNDFINEINKNSDFDERIIACITTLSALLKTQTNCEQVTYAMQIFTTLMMTTNKQAIQEAAVEGLLRLQRFGSPEIYERLCKWNPPYEVSTRLKLMLKSFVYRKNINFWQKLKMS